MAYQSLGLGTTAGDGTGDTIRDGGDKINDNFEEIYTLIGTGTALTSGISATATVVTLTSALATTSFSPSSSDGAALGTTALEWSDLYLADAAVVSFGDDQDVTLTHVADTGLLLNSTMKIQFNDDSQFIHGSSATVLSIGATDEIDLTATAIDINGTADISGTLGVTGVATFAARDIHSSGITIANAGQIGSVGDADAIAIASDGVVTMTQIPVFSAGLNVSGGTIAGTLSTAAQTNITSLGTLTALVVDDVSINGKVMVMTGDTDDTVTFTTAANGALSIVTVDTAGAAGNIQVTADGTVDIDSAGVLTLDSGAAINIEPASGSAILLDGTISIDAGVVTGATSVTSTAFVGNLTGTVATVTQNSITTMTGLTTTGALGAGSIAAGFGAIDNGTSNIRSATITAETAFVPDASGGADLGTTSLEFNNLYLNDLGEIYWGDDQDIILRQIADGQLEIKRNTTSDGTYPRLTLSTGDTDIGANALLGAIEFKAPNEGAGTDAIIAGAQVSAAAEGDFSASNNATSLQFRTAASGAATTKMSVKSDGKVGIGTTGPLALLDVSGNNGDGGYVGVIRNDSNTANYHGLLVSTSYDTTASDILTLKTNSANPVTGGTEVLRVTGDGRGISNFTAQVWINFNGSGTIAIRDSHNVSSISDNGSGDYTVSIGVDMANTNYAIGLATANNSVRQFVVSGSDAVGSFVVRAQNGSGSNADTAYVYCTVFGDAGS